MKALREGLLVVVPTDTVYGIAADASVPAATARIFDAKRRPAGLQLPVLVDSLDQAAQVAVIDDRARALMERFWPGGLTVVVPRRPDIRLELGDENGTVGLRCPDHPVPRALCAEVGPLATTSANVHGEPTPVTAAEVQRVFGGAVAYVIDGGRCEGAPSTVVDTTSEQVVLLREGRVPWSALSEVMG